MADQPYTQPETGAPLKIGDWRFLPTLHRLEGDGVVVHLEPKAASVLQLLAERPGEPLSRQQLLEAAWSGLVVSDDALTQVIIKLRKALGNTPRIPEYIQTIPKRGYRLVAPVTTAEAIPPSAPADHSQPRWLLPVLLLTVALTGLWAGLWSQDGSQQMTTATRAMTPEPMSIAILPFDNVGSSAQQQHLARGVTADLATDLSKLSGLWVINTSLNDGRSVPARYLATGSVRSADGRLVIHVQLLESASRHQLWSERYDRPVNDLFDLQQTISHEIVRHLAVQITQAERRRLAQRYTRNLEAYEDFLHGQAALLLRQQEANRSAQNWYKKAIDKDPVFARAYAGLALSYAADYRNQWVDDGPEALQRAEEMARTAQQIDQEIPEVYWVLGYVAAQQRHHEQALARLQRALSLDHSYADAYALMGGINTYRGQPQKTIPLLRDAMRLRPDAGYLYYLLLGRAYFYLGDQEQALINLREAITRNPANLEARIYLAAAATRSHDTETAEWEAAEINNLQPGFRLLPWLETYPMIDPSQRRQLHMTLEPLGF
jgi:TolB-like protein/DNA-binding winged helix-turn-helix (wHTH) protein/cytochrome c-type biogenesis protein CcmH/NrfG